MSDKFKGKYRNSTFRWQNWNYGKDGSYFITICTKNREHFFGEIENNKMMVSPAGAIAHVLWFQIKQHAKNIELGEFVVMPNHVHGILILNGNDAVGPGHALALHANPRYQNIGKNTISSIIGSYKSAVTKFCNQLELPFGWQSLFHDHVIRNDASFQSISEYIRNNPANWKDDKFCS